MTIFAQYFFYHNENLKLKFMVIWTNSEMQHQYFDNKYRCIKMSLYRNIGHQNLWHEPNRVINFMNTLITNCCFSRICKRIFFTGKTATNLLRQFHNTFFLYLALKFSIKSVMKIHVTVTYDRAWLVQSITNKFVTYSEWVDQYFTIFFWFTALLYG